MYVVPSAPNPHAEALTLNVVLWRRGLWEAIQFR